jgi:hypothetical protein
VRILFDALRYCHENRVVHRDLKARMEGRKERRGHVARAGPGVTSVCVCVYVCVCDAMCVDQELSRPSHLI